MRILLKLRKMRVKIKSAYDSGDMITGMEIEPEKNNAAYEWVSVVDPSPDR